MSITMDARSEGLKTSKNIAKLLINLTEIHLCTFMNSHLHMFTKRNTLIYILLSGKPPSIEVTGYVGRAVMMKCSFSDRYTNNMKYFCKVNSRDPGCEDKITIDVNDKWKTSGRFSLFYHSSRNFSLVKIRDLTQEDAGTYWCAVHRHFSRDRRVTVDEHMDVHLDVKGGENKLIYLH